MDTSTTEHFTPTLIDRIHFLFFDLPAAWVAIGTLGLIVAALWVAYKALPHYRILQALKTAPEVAVSSGAEGLVKVVGEAQPGQEVPEGYQKPRHVWRKTRKFDSRSLRSLATTLTYSVGPILVRDRSGECIVDPREAVVVPGLLRSSVTPHFGNEATYYTEKVILSGAPVFAIGKIGRAKERPGRAGVVRCAMRKSAQGVLLLSAKTERQTIRRFQLSVWSAAAAIFLCVGLAGWMFSQHLLSYPNQSLADYVDALTTRPWVLGPGQNPGHD